MKRLMLLVMTLALTFPAFAQAAAESVLLNANSAAATVKAGSAMGSAFDQSVKQLAGRVPKPTSQPVPSQTGGRPIIPIKSPAVRGGTPPAQGPTIASIQGSPASCASSSQPASTPGSKTAAESARTNCGGPDSASHVASQKSKSVITLSFPK